MSTDSTHPESVHVAEQRTLDELLRFWAAQHPEASALSNAAVSAEYQLGCPAWLDYRSIEVIVDQLARRFLTHGLKPGDAIAIQLPNTAELPLAILGAMRAGLIACPVSMLWRAHEIEQALVHMPVKGIISVHEFAGYSHGDMMCALAARHVNVRFIYGVGTNLADGQTPISDLFDPTISYSTDLDIFNEFPENDLDDVALVLWTVTSDGFKPVLWSHRELIAAGLQHVLAADVTIADRLLNPYPLTNIVGITGLFVPWLLSGTHLSQRHPFDYDGFLRQLCDEEISYTALPAPIAETLLRDGALVSGELELTRLGSVGWPEANTTIAIASETPPVPVYDIRNLNDMACHITARHAGANPAALELGGVHSLDGQHGPLVLLETRVRGRIQDTGSNSRAMAGSLYIRGLSVPNSATLTQLGHISRNSSNPWVHTGIRCTLVEDAANSALCAPPHAVIYHGGTVLREEELDLLYAGYDGFDDAAVFVVDDPVMGKRILAAAVPAPGASPSLQALKSYLENRNVAPFKQPEQIVLVRQIPRDECGHVRRDALLQQI